MTKDPIQLMLELTRPKDLLERLVPNGKLGGVVLDGPLPGPLGERVALTVHFAEPAARHFTVLVQLAWARHKGNATLREGFGADFLPEDDAGRQRLISFAREEVPVEVSRFDERVATDLAVVITHEGQARKESVIDLSQGGAFIRTGKLLPVGATLAFKLRPPLSLRTLKLHGRVAWVRGVGNPRGMGVEFLFDNADQATQVRKLLERLYKRAASLKRPG